MSLLLAISIFFLPLGAFAQDEQGGAAQSFQAEIRQIERGLCGEGGRECLRLQLRGLGGAFEGENIQATLEPQELLGSRMSALRVGDNVILETQDVGGEAVYLVSDLMRGLPLLVSLGLFIALLLWIGGKASLRALLGLCASFVVLFGAILPAILAGYSPLVVSIIGAMVIMALTFLISHGWNPKMLSALGGTCISLLLTGILAYVFTSWARLWGQTDESAVFLLGQFPSLDTHGLLLAGIIIGALGSLDDVTISQASAVFELKHASPRLRFAELYRSALRIGRDHIAGAINTLVLAYAGVSLSLLLLLVANADQESWWLLINRETFATEIMRTLAGSIGLLAAIPLTNMLASWFAEKMTAEQVAKVCHGSGHLSH